MLILYIYIYIRERERTGERDRQNLKIKKYPGNIVENKKKTVPKLHIKMAIISFHFQVPPVILQNACIYPTPPISHVLIQPVPIVILQNASICPTPPTRSECDTKSIFLVEYSFF